MISLWTNQESKGGVASRASELVIPALALFGALIVLPSCGGSSGSGSGGHENGSDEPTYSIAGDARNIDHGSLILQLNGDEELLIDESGPFVFSAELAEGEEYDVRISEQPDGWVCRIDNDAGQIQDNDVDDVSIDCEAQFEVVSDIMQLALKWVGPSSVNIIYSTDHACDWENYALCDDAGIIPDASDGSLSLKAVDDGLDPRKGWFFVVDEGDGFRGPVGARPAPPKTDGYLYAVSSDAHRLYIGGAFGHIGMFVGGGATFDSESGQPYGAIPAVHGLVYAVEPDGEGGWYIGGSFNKVGGYPRNNLARIRENGNVDVDWAPEVDDQVYDLVSMDGRVFAAGRFSDANEVRQPHLAAFDEKTGSLDTGWQPNINDTVRTIEARDGSLFVGGEFTEVDGEHVSYIAALDMESGSRREGWEVDVNGFVLDIEASESHLYIAGHFSEVDSAERHQIAALRVGSGELESEWEVIVEFRDHVFGADPIIESIHLYDSTLYIGGYFDHINDETRSHLASVDAGSGALSEWNPGASGSISGFIHSIVRQDDAVFVGGSHLYVSGEAQYNLAAFDADSAELTAWSPRTSHAVHAVAAQPGSVYAGGSVVAIEGVRTAGLAALDLRNGTVVDEWMPRVNYSVAAIELADDKVYIGGNFTQLNGEYVPYLAALDANSGEVADGWSPVVDGAVYSMAIDDDEIYVGGAFRNVNLQEQAGVASLSRHDGSIVSSWSGQVEGTVRSLLVEDSSLYAGGYFVSSDSPDHENLVAFDRGDGGLIDDWNPAVDGEVLALAADGDRLFVGGGFGQVDGHSREYIAAVYRNGGGLDQAWSGAVNLDVRSLQVSEGRLYVGGSFWRPMDQPAALVALDPAHGGWISEWNPGGHVGRMNGVSARQIYSIHIADGIVFTGGAGGIDSLGAYDEANGDVQW